MKEKGTLSYFNIAANWSLFCPATGASPPKQNGWFEQHHLARVRLIGLWGQLRLHTCCTDRSHRLHPTISRHSRTSPACKMEHLCQVSLSANHYNKPAFNSTTLRPCLEEPSKSLPGGVWQPPRGCVACTWLQTLNLSHFVPKQGFDARCTHGTYMFHSLTVSQTVCEGFKSTRCRQATVEKIVPSENMTHSHQ